MFPWASIRRLCRRRLVLEIVVGPMSRPSSLVGQDRHRELDPVRVVLERLGRVDIVGADGDRLDIRFLEGLVFLAERLKLLHAVGALAAQEEEDEDVLASLRAQVPSCAGRIRLRERIGGRRAPDQRAKRLQIGPVDRGLIGTGGVGG